MYIYSYQPCLHKKSEIEQNISSYNVNSKQNAI